MHTNQEASGERKPDQDRERLGVLCANKAAHKSDQGDAVEDDHDGGDNLRDNAEPHGRQARFLELIAGQEFHRMLEA